MFVFRYWIITKTHGMSAHWIKRIKMLELVWLAHQLVVMWWNCKSESTTMVKSLKQNSKHLVVDQPLHPAHWQQSGWREKPLTKPENWRTQILRRNFVYHQSNCIAQVSIMFINIHMWFYFWIHTRNCDIYFKYDSLFQFQCWPKMRLKLLLLITKSNKIKLANKVWLSDERTNN